MTDGDRQKERGDYHQGMFKPTSSQRSLLCIEHRMDRVKRGRLEHSWAHPFRNQALPLIDEQRFAKYFDEDNGRPNRPVRMVLGVLILKEVRDLTDMEALEELEFNMAWHYALDVLPEDAHLCQKTLHNFRIKLVDDDQGAGLFESTTASLIKAARLKTGRQRQDSTHIMSNIKLLTRLGLFVQTVTRFLESLREAHPALCAELPMDLRERYLDREGYFSDARGSEAPRRLAQAAEDVHRLIQHFQGNEKVNALESYALLSRLHAEQCEPDASEPERIKLKEKPAGSSLQSPSDPDATYGHKGKGYEVQLSETCEKDNAFQAVTSVSVTKANASDQYGVLPALEQVQRTCGETPEMMHADAGYGSGANILRAREMGTELLAPIASPTPTKLMPIEDFEFNEEGTRVLRCPGDMEPIEQRTSLRDHQTYASFAGERCRQCPLNDKCPTRQHAKKRVLDFDKELVAMARRRKEQKTRAFKESHKIRSGIEATNSELKRSHRLGKLRVRRRKRVELSVRLKVLALNMKRYVNHLVEKNAVAMIACPVCA